MNDRPLEDHEIAEALQRRGLELTYLSELAASLGFSLDEGWSEEVFAAIEQASSEQRRRAALRTLRVADDDDS